MAKKLLCILMAAMMLFTFVACDTSTQDPSQSEAAAKDGKDGKDGITPHIGENGNWFIGDEDTGICAQGPKGDQGNAGKDGEAGKDGTNGVNGTNGVTPHIGENGNWFIGTEDTGISAQGPKGDQGDAGKDGENGDNGKDGNGILRLEIIDGYLWVTYTNAPDTPVNVGKLTEDTLPPEGDTPVTTEALEFVKIYDVAYSVRLKDLTATSIVIPSAYEGKPVTQIQANGFQYASALESIVIPESITAISDYAFDSCNRLTSVSLPTGLQSIGSNAFNGCNSLKSISIPDGVKSIGAAAFYECTALESINIPSSVTSLASSTFYGCSKLIEVQDGISYVDTWAIDADTAITNANLRAGTLGIAAGAFNECTKITSLFIPQAVIAIGDNAFQCASLQLESITVEAGNSVYCSSGNCLIEIASQTLILGCKNSVIPADGSVTVIGKSAFYKCKTLTHIEIPDGVKRIEVNAFNDCMGLASIVIPTSVTWIGTGAFQSCNALATGTVYYDGTAEEWTLITKNDNVYLASAAVYCYSETQIAGKYWHYVDGVPTKW